jgi:hypothetical protein
MWLCSHTLCGMCHNLVEITKQHRISYFLLCASPVKLFTLVYDNIIGLFGSLMSEKAVETALFSAFILLS